MTCYYPDCPGGMWGTICRPDCNTGEHMTSTVPSDCPDSHQPVAWMAYTEGGTSAYVTDNPNDLIGAYRALPLYTAPPQRKPLTDEEIGKVAAPYYGTMGFRVEAFARAIERAHGIGGSDD